MMKSDFFSMKNAVVLEQRRILPGFGNEFRLPDMQDFH